MKFIYKLMISLLVGTMAFLIIWSWIGRPITLNHYFSKHNISEMNISLIDSKDGMTSSKELSKEEIDDFLKKFGLYKIYDPLFRKAHKIPQDYSYINIELANQNKSFGVIFPLSEQGSINLGFYVFYPYHVGHKDMYDYLTNLLCPSQD